MVHAVKEPKKRVRRVGFCIWIIGLVVISYFAYYGEETVFNTTRWGAINRRELLYMAAPLFTFFLTLSMHVADRHYGGGGVAQRGQEIEKLHNLQPDVISGTMTKLSVLAALASVFIVFIQQTRVSGYDQLVQLITSAGFLISIFLMLISVKTYDYANRFNWENHPQPPVHVGDKSPYRIGLSTKAFRLDIVSFYFLLFTACLSTGLIETWFPIPASLLCGFLLWISYFFKTGDPDVLRNLQPYSVTLAVHEIEPAKTWYQQKLAFIVSKPNVLSKAGFSIELQQVANDSPKAITQISFRVANLNAVAKTLRDKGADVTQDIQTNTTLKVKEFIIRDSNGTLLRFIEE